jgi:hypothetical protein
VPLERLYVANAVGGPDLDQTLHIGHHYLQNPAFLRLRGASLTLLATSPSVQPKRRLLKFVNGHYAVSFREKTVKVREWPRRASG